MKIQRIENNAKNETQTGSKPMPNNKTFALHGAFRIELHVDSIFESGFYSYTDYIRLYNRYALFSIECQKLCDDDDDDCFFLKPFCAIAFIGRVRAVERGRSTCEVYPVFLCSFKREQEREFNNRINAIFFALFVREYPHILKHYYDHFLCVLPF